jgi:hypothetical protein
VSAVVFAALAGLCSPVGAVSLGVVLAGCFITGLFPRRWVFAAGAACVFPTGIVMVLFPEGGWYPFAAGRFLIVVASLLVIAWFGRDYASLRWIILCYGLAVVAAFFIESPLGGNVARLAWLMAAPAGALVIRRYRRVLLPAFTVFAIIWSWAYVKMSLLPAPPTARAAYYQSLTDHLAALPGPQRVEVVPTPSYRQADELALKVGIARGWETQLDRELNPLFYDSTLTETTFHEWLLAHSVNLVALPLRPVHEHSRDEAAVVRAEPAYLHLVWSDTNWKLYAVEDARPLADHGATVTKVEPESLTVQAAEVGWTTVKFRYTKLYRVAQGDACIEENRDGWIDVLVRTPGTVVLSISLHGLFGSQSACPVHR